MAYTTAGGGKVLSAQEAAALGPQGRNTNSIMAGWVDRGPWYYWDTLTIVSGAPIATSYQLFSVQIGQQNPLLPGTMKTKLQTNMVRGNQFPPPRCLLLFDIGWYLFSTMAKVDIDTVLANAYFEFRIDEKIFHEGHLEFYPAGAGLMGVTMNSGESVYTNGLPAPQASRRYGEWSKYIAPEQQFSMSLIFPAGLSASGTEESPGPGINILCVLDGLTDRSVQ